MVSRIYSETGILCGVTTTSQSGRMAGKMVLVNRFQKKSTRVLISSRRTLSEKISRIVSVKKSWSIFKKFLKIFEVEKFSTSIFTTETQPPTLSGWRYASPNFELRIDPAHHIRYTGRVARFSASEVAPTPPKPILNRKGMP